MPDEEEQDENSASWTVPIDQEEKISPEPVEGVKEKSNRKKSVKKSVTKQTDDSSSAALKFLDALGNDIVEGKLGKGQERFNKLRSMGFNTRDINSIQREVNKRLRKR